MATAFHRTGDSKLPVARASRTAVPGGFKTGLDGGFVRRAPGRTESPLHELFRGWRPREFWQQRPAGPLLSFALLSANRRAEPERTGGLDSAASVHKGRKQVQDGFPEQFDQTEFSGAIFRL